jgi:hypothetical protein
VLDRDEALKKLPNRVKTIQRYLDAIATELSKADQNDLHVAVLVIGRAINRALSRFEFDSRLEHRRDIELNPSLVHVVSHDQTALHRLRELELDMLSNMHRVLEERLRKTLSNR